MKLKYVRYFGKFYEHENKLGWMPFYQVILCEILAKGRVKWLKHKDVHCI